MKRCPFLGACFGESQRSGIEVPGRQFAPSVSGFPAFAPVQASGDHQVKDQPKVIIKAERNPLSHTAECFYGMLMDRLNRRIGSAQKKWPGDLRPLENMAK